MNMIGSLLRKKKNKEREIEREWQGDNFPQVTENDFSSPFETQKSSVIWFLSTFWCSTLKRIKQKYFGKDIW